MCILLPLRAPSPCCFLKPPSPSQLIWNLRVPGLGQGPRIWVNDLGAAACTVPRAHSWTGEDGGGFSGPAGTPVRDLSHVSPRPHLSAVVTTTTRQPEPERYSSFVWGRTLVITKYSLVIASGQSLARGTSSPRSPASQWHSRACHGGPTDKGSTASGRSSEFPGWPRCAGLAERQAGVGAAASLLFSELLSITDAFKINHHGYEAARGVRKADSNSLGLLTCFPATRLNTL